MNTVAYQRLVRLQAGVISRRQLHGVGVSAADLKRLVRRRDLTRVHSGVFVTHTGQLSLLQQQWAALMALWPAALAAGSAIDLPPDRPIHVAVDWSRRVQDPPGVRVHRLTGFEAKVAWATDPPRVRAEEAALDVAQALLVRGDPAAAFAALAKARERTTTGRIVAALGERPKVRQRPTLTAMVDDLANGTHSVLERGYLTHVALPHGLPAATRQARSTATGRGTRHDLRYDDFGLVVELDGLAFHTSARARNVDADRDLANLAVRGDVTIRLTYDLVFRRSCTTAGRIGRVLQRHGWTGVPLRCDACR